MLQRSGEELGGLGDGPGNRENDNILAIRMQSMHSRRNGNSMSENDPREAAKQQLVRSRSALGNLTNGQQQQQQHQTSNTSEVESEPPTKVMRVEKVEPIDTMNRLETDPNYEPPCAAERLFETIDNSTNYIRIHNFVYSSFSFFILKTSTTTIIK